MMTTPRMTPLDTFVGPTGLQTRLEQLIDSAQTTLDVQMYLFTVKPLADKIVAAKSRGVAVRVILDPDEAGERNYGLVDHDPEDVADLQAIFDQDWKLANGMQATPPDLNCTRLIASPNNSQQRILGFISSATSTLDVEVLYITDVNVRNAIGAAKNRGVTVRVILESPTDQPSNADTATYLKNLSIPVKYVDNQFYLHAKLIIADGVAFVGSENMSPTSLTKNREVGALALESTEVSVIQTRFESDWAATALAP
jgi:phosphatidylserine/phosphatidylglycerophosphate/cardiolipin synthase-like enzyme